ncbi:ankyrin repeat-containing domain protein, partial [Phycomyces blakesleeanus]
GLIKFALDHGVDVNSVANGYTPLQLACTSDLNIASVQYLIDRGAEVNSQRWSRKYSHDKSKAVAGATGSTALHIACINGCVRTVDLLLRNGAVSDVKDKYGLTAVDHAITKQNTDILRLLQIKSQSQSHLQFQLQIQIQAQPCLHSHSPAIPISPSRISPQSPTPELSYSNSSEDSDPQTISPCHRLVRTVEYDPQDWYSHGVLHPYQEDSCYLASLERRACG